MWLYLVALVGFWTLLRLFRERQAVTNMKLLIVASQAVSRAVKNQKKRKYHAAIPAHLYHTANLLCGSLFFSLSLGLWGLVNNAGISVFAINEWQNKQDFVKVLDVNLLGLIDVTLNMLPLVRKARGRVVNVASVMGRVSLFGGGYCISKYGVEAFSDSLRRELSYFGVKVAIIEPGGFKTNISNSERVSHIMKKLWDQSSSEVKEIYGEKFLDSYLRASKLLMNTCSEDLSMVTDCMEHALTSCHPRTRYSAGWDAKLFYLPMSYLPTFLLDAIYYWGSGKPAQAL
ncbi:retinol dehydrogenase 7-like [Psammomys obesus]|uniref:retinol dehydrogenase 7-like n=1 Tax=Psammomys obesus TaxID=48139 RepID=UPI0024528A30|nr:retinol dehydrogenase 7-like [Psammomys obesus]